MYRCMYWKLSTGEPGRMGLGLDLDLDIGGIAVMGAVDNDSERADEHGGGGGGGERVSGTAMEKTTGGVRDITFV